MGSPIDSSIRCAISLSKSIRDSPTGGAFDFVGSGGISRKETEEFWSTSGFVSDDLQAILAPQQLQAALAPEAPPDTARPGSGRLDKLYELHFTRLDRELEKLKALKQLLVVPELPKVREPGNVSARIHSPSSVTKGYVPTLDVVAVNAEGGVVFGSALEERKAGVRK